MSTVRASRPQIGSASHWASLCASATGSAEGSTSSKRHLDSSPDPKRSKRAREGTPLGEQLNRLNEDDELEDAQVGHDETTNSARTLTGTTITGPSSYLPQLDDAKVVTTSDGESVLFSEQIGRLETKMEFGEMDSVIQTTTSGESSRTGPSPDLTSLGRFVASPNTYADRMTKVIEGRAMSIDDPSSETSVASDDEPSNGPGSYHSGDSSQYEMAYRPPLDRTIIKKDIRNLHSTIGGLMSSQGGFKYRIIDRLGEGTFSSVYLALDCRHNSYDNEYWTGVLDTIPFAKRYADTKNIRSDVKVALKKILVTSSPQRIENELHILESLRGCRNVSQLITAFREQDQVVIALPYHPSDDFRQFYRSMDPPHIRLYMKNLFQALKDIHQRGIIHRDVKPANFLFDYEAGTGVLVDFGLAERYRPPRRACCQHAPASEGVLQGSRITTTDTPVVEQAVYNARKRSGLGEGRVGFPQDDKRAAIKTNRAGTRGFRAPEVLLKCPDQTVAIDVWSAGVMLLSMLTHRFPVFNSSDDIEALMELAAIFGKTSMERCAMLHNRTMISNVPTMEHHPPSLSSVILTLNPHLYTPQQPNSTPQQAKDHIESIDAAIDLCSRLLRLDHTKRLSAEGALRHRFLRDGMEEKSEILTGLDGKCGMLHEYEDGKHLAYFGMGRTMTEMRFGQGIPPSREDLCPEHQHLQERYHTNPLRLQFPGPESAAGSDDENDDGDLESDDESLTSSQEEEQEASHRALINGLDVVTGMIVQRGIDKRRERREDAEKAEQKRKERERAEETGRQREKAVKAKEKVGEWERVYKACEKEQEWEKIYREREGGLVVDSPITGGVGEMVTERRRVPTI